MDTVISRRLDNAAHLFTRERLLVRLVLELVEPACYGTLARFCLMAWVRHMNDVGWTAEQIKQRVDQWVREA